MLCSISQYNFRAIHYMSAFGFAQGRQRHQWYTSRGAIAKDMITYLVYLAGGKHQPKIREHSTMTLIKLQLGFFGGLR